MDATVHRKIKQGHGHALIQLGHPVAPSAIPKLHPVEPLHRIHQGRVATVADPETGEERPLTVRKHSDRLLEVLLKFRYGDQMADRLKVKVEDTGLDADALLRMPSEERRALTELLAKYKSNRREEDDDE